MQSGMIFPDRLLERISWLVRDAARGANATDNQCHLIFSEQRSYPYEDLCEYLNKLQRGKDQHNCSIEWDYLDQSIESIKHKNEHPIHFGDLVASAFHMAIEPKQHDMVDDRFLRNLIPAIYSRNGKCYGLKMFPPRRIEEMRAAGDLGFLKLIT
jgi:FAD/FMN-containing dehydrogenase